MLLSEGGRPDEVAPFTGAWIETPDDLEWDTSVDVSPPSRGRGLKLEPLRYCRFGQESPPSRGRGLKRP